MSSPADNSCVFLEGPWNHRLLQANGCQFHLAHMGEHRDDRPLVLLLHGYPEYWWAWRGHIEAIAEAGYEVAAVDLRGIAGSDKTPNAVDGLILSQDIPAIVRSLGASRAVVIGHGRGGQLAWSAPAIEPNLFDGVLTFSAPHTRTLQRAGTHLTLRTWRHVLTTFLPSAAKRTLVNPEALRELLAEWSAPGNDGASSQAELYAAAMRLPEAANTALEQLRWSYTAVQRPSGRRYFEVTRQPINVPVWAVRGALDPLLPERAWARDPSFTTSSYRHITVAHAGHFVPEEARTESSEIILEFLASLHRRSR
ncbi:alpha/beta hydrolase [Arcanobacterium haemolyticum]|nr:alpha/beta hydrolase [Arcanobacterium haemolyticum]